MDTAELKYNDRHIRVFISSTFRDMQEERDYLVKFVFPQLRKLCESRGVTWGEVDLRWGVTDEQAAEGKVLPICLEEIKRCRPYFIGLLGERYGWVPDTIPPELLERESWLKEQFDGRKSVTELEILHGVLRDPKMAGHAYFYFRDPEYIKGKSSDFASEDEPSKEKLRILKQQIRDHKFPVQENYPTPETLGELVLKDLTAVIDELYPEGSQPDPLDREAMDHEAYAASRAQVYIGRDSYYRRLDEHAAGQGTQPLVVLGESGCGKSALLANWVRRYRKTHPDTLIIQHYIGASPYSADWMGMLRRIMGEFKRNLHIEDKIPSKPDELRDAFKVWLYQAAAQKRIVLVLDALNQLADTDRAPDLPWLPPEIPANLRLFVSTLPGRPLEEIRRRNWPQYEVTLLETGERRKLIAEYLKLQARSLEPRRIDRIVNTPQSANPLYLKVLLDELRVFGVYEQLDQRIDHYLEAQNPFELYKKVIARWQEDYGRGTSLVKDSLSLLWAARRGLSETELLDAMGTNELPLPRAKWSPLYLAMSNALISRGGLLTFAHDFIRKASGDAFLVTEDSQRKARLRVADCFEKQPIGPRQADELPWLLQQAGEKGRLQSCLLNIDRFLLMHQANENELLGYWIWLGQERTMGTLYLKSFEIWEAKEPKNLSYAANQLGLFLYNSAQYMEAEPLYQRALAIDEASLGKDHPDIAIDLNNLAELYRATNRLSEAEPLMKRVVLIILNFTQQTGHQHQHLNDAIGTYAKLLQDMGQSDQQVDSRLNEILKPFGMSFGEPTPESTKLPTGVSDLIKRAEAVEEGEYSEAINLYGKALSECERVLGSEHPKVFEIIDCLYGINFKMENYPEAEKYCRQLLAFREKTLGPEHTEVAFTLNNLGICLMHQNQLSDAETLQRQSLEIREKVFGPEHSSTANGLANLARVLWLEEKVEEAEPLIRRSVDIWEKTAPTDSRAGKAWWTLGAIEKSKGNLDQAKKHLTKSLQLVEKGYPVDHSDTIKIRQALSELT